MEDIQFHKNKVSIAMESGASYPSVPPYHPNQIYPEYPFEDKYVSSNNAPYDLVRESLRLLNMDQNRFGHATWNPFSELVQKGNTVVIKPNFVQDFHDSGKDIYSVITHGSVIRAIIDYVCIALKDKGKIIIADAPMMNSNFDKIVELMGIKEIIAFIHKNTSIKVDLVDLRVMRVDLEDGLVVKRHKLRGDPLGYKIVDLGNKSKLYEINNLSKKLRGSDYDIEKTVMHHTEGRHEYLVSNTVLNADLFINVPKLKTHKKSGVTINLKNLIGINGDKNWIPHYRIGGPNNQGDEFSTKSRLRHVESYIKENFKKFVYNYSIFNPITKKIRKIQKKVVEKYDFTQIRAGGWHGNDTLWRSVIDLNLILMHLNNDGNVDANFFRNYFSVVDGIIGAERNGPMNPESKNAGLIISGFSPIAVDLCGIRLMGFDHNKIPLIANILKEKEFFGGIQFEDIEIQSNDPSVKNIFRKDAKRFDTLAFEAPDSWKGRMELDN